MKLPQRSHLEEDQKTMKNQRQMTKPGMEYVINQAIIWIVIVFLAVVIIKKFFPL